MAFFCGLFIVFIAAAVYTEQYLLIIIPFAVIVFFVSWQNMNAVFYLLLLSLPFSFEYNFTSSLGTDIPDEFLMLLVSLIFFCYAVYSPASFSKKLLQHPLIIFLIIILCWSLITVVFSTNKTVSIKYLLAKSWYCGAFLLAPLILFKEKKNIITTAVLLTSSMMLVMLVILFKHSGNRFSFATINDAVTPFFRNHVNYSAMLVCIIPVLFAIYKLTKNKIIKTWMIGAMAIALIALFFSYARGAWLALLAGIIAGWLIRTRSLLYTYILAILVMTGFVFWAKANDRYLGFAPDYSTTIFHRNFSEHLISTYKLKDVSTAERFYRWVAGVRMIKDKWLTGYGPNTFYDNYKEYTVPAYKTWVSDNPEHSTVHNYYLLTAIEQGIQGLVFLLLLLGSMLYYAQHLYQRVKDIFYKTVAMTTGIILVMIMVLNFLSDLVETDKIGSLFFLCLAMLIATDLNTRSNPSADVEGIS